MLVSSTDGVGTKALIAQAAGRFDTIGVDLVAMCVDDLVCQGAEPLFFLDYIAVGKLDPDHIEQLVEGVAEGCRQAGCALIGGEMAEHPGAMEPGEFDLVGFAVGVAERDQLITGEHVRPGDVLIGLPSPGLRSNGYSLARRVLLERGRPAARRPGLRRRPPHAWPTSCSRPSVIYAPAIAGAARAGRRAAVAHITGGGIAGNLDPGAAQGRRRRRRPPLVGGAADLRRDPAARRDRRRRDGARSSTSASAWSSSFPPKDAYRALDVLRAPATAPPRSAQSRRATAPCATDVHSVLTPQVISRSSRSATSACVRRPGSASSGGSSDPGATPRC